jgi:hypothetical protein
MTKSKPAYRSSAPAVVTPGPEYISKQIAAQWLGLSVRRVLELSNTGAIRRRQVTDPMTKRRQTVLLARDVQRAVVDGQKPGSQGAISTRLKRRRHANKGFSLGSSMQRHGEL